MNRSTMRGSSAGTSAMSCGVDDHVLEPPQRAVLGQRLLGEDVERGALERAVLQPLDQRASSITVPRPTLTSTAPA
jgi:hypothetical protein